MKPRFMTDTTRFEDNLETTHVPDIIIIATLATYLVAGVICLIIRDWKTVITICAGSILLIPPFGLFRTGRARTGNMVLMIVILVTVTFIATVGQGIHDLAVTAYPAVIIYAGLTSDRTMLRLCGGLTFAALLWLAFGEAFGLFAATPVFRDPFNVFSLSILIVLLSITVFAVDLLSSNVRKTIARARHEIEERRKAEQALRDSNELFSQFLLHSPVYAYIKEVEPGQSRVIQASENYKNMVGIAGHDMIGRTMEELFPAGFAAKITADDWAVVSEEKPLTLDEDLNGRHYTTIKFPISRRGRKYLAGYTIDITERKNAEEALRASEERFRKMFEGHSAAMLVIDPDTGVILDANEAASDFYGWPKQRLTQMRIQQINTLPPEAVNDEMAKAKSFERTRFSFRHLRADGSIRDVEVMSSGIQVEGKNVLYSVINDVTERMRAEDLLRKGEERYRLMLESAPLAIAITRGTEIIYGNPSFLSLFGFSSVEELRGYPPFDLLATEWRPRIEENVRRRAQGLFVPDHYEMVCLRKDGTRVPVLMYFAQAEFTDGPAVVAFIMDISEQKRDEEEKRKLQDQLIQAQKMESVGRLAGGVAHDFNNMLGVILGHTEIALQQVEAGHPLWDDLEEIRKATVRSADLTRQLLAFAHRQTITPRVLDLNETVQGMLKMLRRMIGEEIALAWHPHPELWPVCVDPSQIDQMLANLCVNARDAIGGVGTIDIKTANGRLNEAYCAGHRGSSPGEYVQLSVSDDGSGMDTDTISHLFEPFFTTKSVGQGTGLGLATVYGTVKQNGGFIDVESAPGKGTTFTIYLPRFTGTEPAKPDAIAAAPRRGQETILLVEDEPAILKLTTRLLEEQGYTVLAARTPGEGLRLAREHAGDIHLLMTDVVMPEMNGRELAQNILSFHPRIRCLFMSGYTADVISHHGVLDDGVSFIHKPFSINDLSDKIREMLEGA